MFATTFPALTEKWDTLCAALGVTGDQQHPVQALLVRQYTQKNRYYHNLTHIASLFEWQDVLQHDQSVPQAVSLAIWFHDLIYRPGRRDNEARSARMAQKALAPWHLPNELVEGLRALILATTRHLPTGQHPDEALFLDMDIAILGAEQNTYDAYCLAIRQEHRHFPDLLYRAGRAKVLRHFLNRDRLYHHPWMYEQLEQPARTNLARELEQLHARTGRAR